MGACKTGGGLFGWWGLLGWWELVRLVGLVGVVGACKTGGGLFFTCLGLIRLIRLFG